MTSEIYTLSLHDALPIFTSASMAKNSAQKLEWILLIHQLPPKPTNLRVRIWRKLQKLGRSEEHTSELQSRPHLVCRLLLEKKKKKNVHSQQLYPNQACNT